jgi:hypothetical protein
MSLPYQETWYNPIHTTKLKAKYEVYSESNLSWAVNKTMRKKLLYRSSTYIIKLLLSIVTAGTEALVIWGNTLLYACVREVCRLWAQPCFDSFNQLLIIIEALWSKPVLRIGKSKQVVVTQQDQGCKGGGQTTPGWNAPALLKCEQLYADTRCHGGALHRISAFHTLCSEWLYAGPPPHNMPVILLWSPVAWISPSALYSCPRKQLPSAFWQADVCLNFFWLVWWMCVHPLLWLLFGFSIHKWNPGFITSYS